MNQPRLHSAIETFCSTAIGFLISWLLNVWVLRAWGFPISTHDSFWITCIFTITSLLRQYAVRRWFNRLLHKQLVKHGI